MPPKVVTSQHKGRVKGILNHSKKGLTNVNTNNQHKITIVCNANET